jgi:hypothetical protein
MPNTAQVVNQSSYLLVESVASILLGESMKL